MKNHNLALLKKYAKACMRGNSWFRPKKRRNPPFFVKTLPVLTLNGMYIYTDVLYHLFEALMGGVKREALCFYLSKLRSMIISRPLSSLGFMFLISLLSEAPVWV